MPTHEAPTSTSQLDRNENPAASDSSRNTCSTTTTTTTTATRKPLASANMRQDSGSSAVHKQSGRSSLSSNGSGDGSESRNSTFMPNSNADYDHIRNTTLMFFLDRLYIASKDGKEARTLHDLSCLFGTREFTKEMRQIVGASRNGLKKFLQTYPSLFTIDGDRVYLTQLKQDSVAPVRDYNKEAVEYFKQKLLQFGTSLVPIRNLFGYRSQASQEVRHVSGKNTKEFKQFLSLHEDIFEILADEHVVLKSALQELELRGETYSSLQQTHMMPTNEETVIDPYLNKQFAHLIEDCMKKLESNTSKQTTATATATANNDDVEREQQDDLTTRCQNNKVTIEYLHELILKDCNNQLFLKMVKTIEDFKVFLRMHPKIFKRFRCDQEQRDYVCLLTDDERKEMELASYPSLLTRQQSTLKRTETNESNLSDNSSLGNNNTNNLNSGNQPMSLPPQSAASNKQDQPLSLMIGKQQNANNVREQTPVTKQTKSSSDQRSSSGSKLMQSKINQEQPNNNHSSSLRATAPPFVPSTHLNQNLTKQQQQQQQTTRFNREFGANKLPLQNSSSNRQQQQTSESRAPLQRSVSNLGPTTTTGSSQRAVIDPRAALRSYLLKASAVNSGNGIYSPNKLSNGAQHNQNNHHKPLLRQNSNLVHGARGRFERDEGGEDDLRTRTVNIVREASNIVTRIMTTTDAVAFDCKGYNLGFDGQITLIQFAFLPNLSNQTPNSGFMVGSSDKENNNINNNNNNKTKQTVNKQKPEVCIFDLITNPELAYCLKPLLESEQVVKIVHDVRNKSNALFSQFGIMLNHVFDTQVANLVIQQQETGKPAYKSRYISMSKLCEIYGDESLTKYRNLIKAKTRHSTTNTNSTSTTTNNNNNNNNNKIKDVNYWRTRPLTDAMVYESTMDVYCLVDGVYQNLKSKIIPEYKPLFEQLNLEGVLARIKPDEIRSVKKERKIDLEVIDLKRKLYSDTTSSIVLSNREIRLLRHIDLSEEVRQKIQQCKKVAKKLERLDMKAAQLQQQSMTSQVSSDADNTTGDPQSMAFSSVNQFNSLSSGTPLNDNNNPATTDQLTQAEVHNGSTSEHRHQRDGLFNDKGELDETKMSNLMNSSMFDELKDRMIESSSLLESLANDVDDDDDEVASGSEHHLLHKHSGSHDDCRCLCHKSGSSIGGGSSNLEGEKSNSSLKLSLSSTHSSSHSTTDHEDASVESKAVDMAIQCDLLS